MQPLKTWLRTQGSELFFKKWNGGRVNPESPLATTAKKMLRNNTLIDPAVSAELRKAKMAGDFLRRQPFFNWNHRQSGLRIHFLQFIQRKTIPDRNKKRRSMEFRS
jgi:hypothetical protein